MASNQPVQSVDKLLPECMEGDVVVYNGQMFTCEKVVYFEDKPPECCAVHKSSDIAVIALLAALLILGIFERIYGK